MSAYKEYRGGQEYFKLLKARFKKPIKNQETIIITGKVIESDSCPFSSLIYQIIEKHYYKATHDIKPLTIIIPDEKVLEVKKYLIENNCPFNDGYETIHFSRKYFITAAIINKKTVGKKTSSSLSKTSFKARIISFSTFNSISELGLNGSWILIDSEKHELLGESPYQIINNLETEQLLKLF